MKKTYQIWYCEKCKKVGMVTFTEEEDGDVMGVANKIGRNHRELSPECFSTDTTCVSHELINPKTINCIPEWAQQQVLDFIKTIQSAE